MVSAPIVRRDSIRSCMKIVENGGAREMRSIILMATVVLIWLALPVAAGAESDPRWNGTYDKLRHAPHDHQKCGCRRGLTDEKRQSGGLHWVHNNGVTWRSQRINRFRAVHGGVIWRARAFPGSVRRAHGFRGHGFRGHHGRRR